MTTQVTPDVDILRREVQRKYTAVATTPDQTFHFHHGRPLAEMLGYPMDLVDSMPPQAVESFSGAAGEANAHAFGGVVASIRSRKPA
jgi:arsenite methyltransferase